MNGIPQSNGDVTIRVNTATLRLLYTITAAAVALVIAVVGFFVRIEVQAATMHSDVANMLGKISETQASIVRIQEQTMATDTRLWELKIQVEKDSDSAKTTKAEIVHKIGEEVKTAVDDKIPDANRR